MKRGPKRRGPKRKTHCLQGHPLSGKNLYVKPSNGSRECIKCRDAAKVRHLEKLARLDASEPSAGAVTRPKLKGSVKDRAEALAAEALEVQTFIMRNGRLASTKLRAAAMVLRVSGNDSGGARASQDFAAISAEIEERTRRLAALAGDASYMGQLAAVMFESGQWRLPPGWKPSGLPPVELVEPEVKLLPEADAAPMQKEEAVIVVEVQPCICGCAKESHASGGDCSGCEKGCHLYVRISDAMASRSEAESGR